MLAAGGVARYLSSLANIVDFGVVLASLPTLVEPMISGTVDSTSSLKALTVFRLFRVFRIARLLHKVKSMRQLLATVFTSAVAISHLGVFIGFSLVTEAIVATTLFARPYAPEGAAPQALNAGGYSMYAGGAVPRFHFDTFADSLVSVFVIMTGECLRLVSLVLG